MKSIRSTLYRLITLLVLSFLAPGHVWAIQTDIIGPAGSGLFGEKVFVLPNGNFVVTDPGFDAPGPVTDVGAVHLYNGATLALISTLRGSSVDDFVGYSAPGSSVVSHGITILTNGNFVVSSSGWDNGTVEDAGAVTWCSATTGCNGVVSVANSLVGSAAFDRVGTDEYGRAVTPLTNGNYVVSSPAWSNASVGAAGAVTWSNGNGGTVGVITPNNSLVGGSLGDTIGTGIRALANGNYVVISPLWRNPSPAQVGAGAVTWGNGAGGTVGLISAANSLVGSTSNDYVGNAGVVELTNGNYVVSSPYWTNAALNIRQVGAVTWCNGMTGRAGNVSTSNSLVGGRVDDQIGSDNGGTLGLIPLKNGNYVVSSPNWDDPAGPVMEVGAVTWGNGTTGTTGVVGVANSLIGSTFQDHIGNLGSGSGSIIALTNGNYVVSSPDWNNPTGAIEDAGAVTWGNGTGGTVGPVTPANSLVGGSPQDTVGADQFLTVTGLTNGNYVVASPNWNSLSPAIADAGAVTWGNGTGGTVGLITASNSLVGTTAEDAIGRTDISNPGVVALTNGNYVVSSPAWDNPVGNIVAAGAVTWGSGAGGLVGPVTQNNSLIGGATENSVGAAGVRALSNGNYVAASPYWDNPSPAIPDVGAVTWGNGASGTVGLVTSANSLVGGGPNDSIGTDSQLQGINYITALTNGNYVVASPVWNNPSPIVGWAGAVTWGNGVGGTVGLVSSGNSLVGGTQSDLLGIYLGNLGSSGVTALTNGNYVIATETWDNPSPIIVDARSVTLGSGSGCTVGSVTSENSVIGTVTNGISSFSHEPTTNRLVVGRGASNRVTVLESPVVSISGRVTTPTGLGLRNAIVSITDSLGVRQTATTSSFGNYSFASVRKCETYLMGVSSKRYRFASRSVQANDGLTNVDFVGLE